MKTTHKPLVLIPSYNSGKPLYNTVLEALTEAPFPVWVVVDGSTDGSEKTLQPLQEQFPDRLKLIIKPANEGKGAAVRTGSEQALKEGFTHALVMDSDGQHPADHIVPFLEASAKTPEAMVLGQPVFDENVPLERLYGRKLSVWLVQFETLSTQVGDPLYGFRVYPIAPMLEVMSNGKRSNRYDFDPEVAVRLCWKGTPALKLPAPVKYLSAEQGGISHFHYLRDNLRFILLHTKLITELIVRFPILLFR